MKRYASILSLLLCCVTGYSQAYNDLTAAALLDSAIAKMLAGDLSDYRELLDMADAKATAEQDTATKLITLRHLAQRHAADRHTDSAQLYIDEGLAWSRSYGDPKVIANYMYIQAEVEVLRGNFKVAYQIYNDIEAEIVEKAYDFLPHYYASFARLHYLLGESELAFDKLKRAARIYTEDNDLTNLSATYNNLGILYKTQNEYDSSLVYYHQALDISKAREDTTGMAYAYGNIGRLHYLFEDQIQAAQNFLAAFEIKPEDPSPNLINNYAELLISSGALDRAEEALLGVMHKQKTPSTAINTYRLLSLVHRERGDFEQALFYKDSLLTAKEDYLSATTISEIEKLKARHDTEKKEQQIELLKEEAAFRALELRSNRITLVATAIGLGLILVIGGQFMRNKVITTRANNLELQQQLLRSQMNPHFIFNALSNIQTSILKQENKKAVNYLSKFARLLRGILERSKHMTSTLEEEVAEIENYLALQQVRFGHRLQYHVDVDDRIELSLIKVPTLLFQPIVENAIEHGIEHIDQGKVDLTFVQEGDRIICTVINDSSGASVAESSSTSSPSKNSMSTDIIRRRLAYYSRHRSRPYTFKLQDIRVDGDIKRTRAVIHLPIIDRKDL